MKSSTFPSGEGAKKRHFIKSDLFSFCSVCSYKGWFSLEELTAWHFLPRDGPVQIRGNWFNGFGLIAEKTTSTADTALFCCFCFISDLACAHLFFMFILVAAFWRIMSECVWLFHVAASKSRKYGSLWCNRKTDLWSIAAVNQHLCPRAQRGVHLTRTGAHKHHQGVSVHQWLCVVAAHWGGISHVQPPLDVAVNASATVSSGTHSEFL